MDIFEGRYFNLNRKFLSCLGLWPYETRRRKVIRAFFMISLFCLSMPHLISAIVHNDDVDRLMLSVLTFATGVLMLFKMVALAVAEDKMKGLYDTVRNNWITICNKKEHEILVQYSERARIIAILYTISISVTGVIVAFLPLFPKILDIINPLERQRPNMHILDGEFFVDRQEYFIELFLCDFMLTTYIGSITIAVDTAYIVSTEHYCAMNAIISYRLRNLNQKLYNYSSISNDESYIQVIYIIKLHHNSLSLISAINDSYSLMFLYIMATNLLAITLDACAIIAHLREPLLLFPFVLFFVALTVHLFTIFYPGQRILDHNLNLCNDAYYNEWYALPHRTKKLLLIFILRCSQPASLSAGGLFLMNLETFSKVMKNALSYIAVLSSFR